MTNGRYWAGPGELGTLFQATQGWVAERSHDKGLKRTTLAGYEILFERLYRDLGADTPVRDFADEDAFAAAYFEDFKSYKVVSEETALRARAEREGRPAARGRTLDRSAGRQHPGGGRHQRLRPFGSPMSFPAPGITCAAAHRRVVPLDARRARSVTYQESKVLEADGWVVVRRKKILWAVVGSAATSTRNEYRNVFAACLNYAVRQRWIPANPLAEVKRRSNRAARERVLRRDDFYDRADERGARTTRLRAPRTLRGLPQTAQHERPKAQT